MKDSGKKLYSIGEVATLSGIPVTTLRYYDIVIEEKEQNAI